MMLNTVRVNLNKSEDDQFHVYTVKFSRGNNPEIARNLANRVESANAYLANAHPGCRHDCIFLICDDCGQATHLDDDRLTGALREAGGRAGFADVRPVVELRTNRSRMRYTLFAATRLPRRFPTASAIS